MSVWLGAIFRPAWPRLVFLIALGWAPTLSFAQGVKLLAPAPEGIREEAATQIAALLVAKESRTPVQRKIDSQLLYATRAAVGLEAAQGVPRQIVKLLRDPVDATLVLVELKARVSDELLSALKALRGVVVASYPKDEVLLVWLHLESLELMAARPDVRFIAPARTPERDTGSVTTQGDRVMNADGARAVFPVNASALKIGVISDSASAVGLARSVGTNEFTSGQVTLLAPGTGTDEGLAMLEIVNDVCPGAQLYFAASGILESSFAASIRALRDAGCSIIVDDIRLPPESPFQDGPVARAVNDVTGTGVLYFCAAGNGGSKSKGNACAWVGDFQDGGTITLPVGAAQVTYRVHSFQTTPTVQNYNLLTPNAGDNLSLFWSDPEGASGNDYDLFLLNAAGTSVLSSSTNFQTGTQDPYEGAAQGSTNGDRVVVVKSTTASARALYVSAYHGRLGITTNGFARGHSNAADALPVAAAPAANFSTPAGPFPGVYTSAQLTETFSSDGPIRKFFNADGSAVTPGNFLIGTSGGSTRQYPVFTAPDGVTTTVPTFMPFFGTSAAAPHAAAVAGLLKAYKPGLTNAQVRDAMINTSLDILTAGTDYDSGAGILRPYEALKSVTVPPVVTVTSPAHNSTVQALTGIAGTATDPNGLAFVPTLVSFTFFHVSSGDYWNGFSWTATQTVLGASIAGNGTWTYGGSLPTGANARTGQFGLSASATNAAGIVSAPSSGGNNILFTVDANPPTVAVLTPAPGSLISNAGTSFTGTANDDFGVNRVVLFIRRESDGLYWDGITWVAGSINANLTSVYNAGAHTWSCTSALPAVGSGLTNGSYTFIAQAVDQSGRSTQFDSNVTVEFVYLWTGATTRDADPNNNSTDWDTAANWLPTSVPGENDIVQIDNGDRVDSTPNRTVRGLRLLSGSLGNYSVTVTGGPGTSVWKSGTVGLGLAVAPGAYLTIDTTGEPRLDGTTLFNLGTITIMASDPANQRQMLGTSATVQNLSGGRIEIARDGLIMLNISTPPLIYNQAGAVLVKTTAAGGRSVINWRIRNDGTVGADAGTLAFDNGGSSSGDAGFFNASAASARIEFAGGTHTLSAGARFTGPGRGLLSGGSLTLNGAAFIGSVGTPAGGFEQTGGRLEGAGSLSMIGGGGSYAWSGGDLATSLSFGAGTSSSIDTTGQPKLDGATLTNAGVMVISASNPQNQQQWLGTSSTLINQSGGRIEVARSGLVMLNISTPPVINNQAGGVILKTVATSGAALVNWRLDNDGTVGADAGTLSFNNGSTVGSAGAFNASTAASRVEFSGGTHILKTGARFTGPGRGLLKGGSLTLNGAATIGTGGTPAGGFEQGGGRLEGAGSLSMIGGSGSYAWSGGDVATSLSFGAGTSSTIDTTGQPKLDGATLTNAGLIVISASNPQNQQQWLGTSSTLINQSGGRIEVARSGLIMLNISTPPVINNQAGGVIVKTVATSGAALVNWRLDNDGTVGADAGTLSFNNGSTVGSAGAFNASTAAARVEFSGGTHLLKAGARFTGPGRGALTGGSLTLNGAATIGTGGTPAGGFEQSGGRLEGTGSLGMIGGSGSYAWSGGDVATSLSFGAGTSSSIDTTGQPRLDGATLTNAGLIVISASDPNNQQQWLGTSSTLINQSGGRIEVARSGLIMLNISTPPVINNQAGGVIVKTGASSGLALVNWRLDNDGTVGADAGTLSFNNGSTVGGAGAFNASNAAARVEFSGGTHFLKAGARFTGPGRSRLTGGNLTLSGAATIGSVGTPAGGFEQTGGILDGGFTLSFVGASGIYAWSGGTIATVVSLDPAIQMTIDTTPEPRLDGGTLINAGTITVSASDPNNLRALLGTSAAILNQVGARIELARDGTIFQNISSPPFVINLGTIAKTAGAGTTDFGSFTLYQRGVLNAPTNTVLRFTATILFDAPNQITGGKMVIQGVVPAIQSSIAISAGATLEVFSGLNGVVDGGGNPLGSIQGPGTLSWKSGTLSGKLNLGTLLTSIIDTTGNPYFDSATLNVAGPTFVRGGSGSILGNASTLNIAAGAVFQIQAATNFLNVSSPPTIVNAGTVKIGGPAALVTSSWNYTQTASGTLDFELGGTNAATPQFSQFQLSTPVQLAGILKVTRVNGFVPVSGNTFPILTFPTSNSSNFTSSVGLGLANGDKLTPTLTAGAVTLSVVRSSLGNWMDLKFGANAGNPLIAGPNATPANDGIANALKFAFNLDPFTSGTAGLPKSMVLIDPVTHLHHLGLSYRRLIAVSDPLYLPRVSGALTGAWDMSGAQVEQVGAPTATGDGLTELVTIRLITPMQPGGQAFLDLMVDYE